MSMATMIDQILVNAIAHDNKVQVEADLDDDDG